LYVAISQKVLCIFPPTLFELCNIFHLVPDLYSPSLSDRTRQPSHTTTPPPLECLLPFPQGPHGYAFYRPTPSSSLLITTMAHVAAPPEVLTGIPPPSSPFFICKTSLFPCLGPHEWILLLHGNEPPSPSCPPGRLHNPARPIPDFSTLGSVCKFVPGPTSFLPFPVQGQDLRLRLYLFLPDGSPFPTPGDSYCL